MRTIDDYLDAARKRNGLTSDRQLSRALGLKPSAIPYFRKKRSWPSDQIMIDIAKLAGMDVDRAFKDRDRWRASGRMRITMEIDQDDIKDADKIFYISDEMIETGCDVIDSWRADKTVTVNEVLVRNIYARMHDVRLATDVGMEGASGEPFDLRYFHVYMPIGLARAFSQLFAEIAQKAKLLPKQPTEESDDANDT